MKRIIARVAVLLLSLSVLAAAPAQAVSARPAAQTHDASIFQSQYVRYCGRAIEDAIRDEDVQHVLKKIAHLPNAAKIYKVIITGSDTVELEYEVGNGEYGNALFSASRVFYDVLSQLSVASPFWAVGTPATSCLQAAVVWDVKTGAKIGAQLRKDVDKFLSWLLPAVPARLTLHANPSNGTVLRISWHENKTTFLDYLFKPSFQVSNGRQIRKASGRWGANNYIWTGLTPGSLVCITVRATSIFGDSAWARHQCAYTSAPHPASCAPKINAVGPVAAIANTTIEIVGNCFGTAGSTSGSDTAYFRISDLTAGWNACWTGDPGTDAVTCNVPSWTNTAIVFHGFAGAYGQGSWVVSNGDRLEIQVWNPQSGKGPATCNVVAGSGSATNC